MLTQFWLVRNNSYKAWTDWLLFLNVPQNKYFFLPLSINTLFSETSVTQILLLAGDNHFGAHHCTIKKSFCVIYHICVKWCNLPFYGEGCVQFCCWLTCPEQPGIDPLRSLLAGKSWGSSQAPLCPQPWSWSFLPLLCFQQVFIHAIKFPDIPSSLNSIYIALILWLTLEFVMYFDWFPMCLQNLFKVCCLFPFMQLSWWIAKMPARSERQVCADGAGFEYWLF